MSIEAPVLGYIKGKAIYYRASAKKLLSEDAWYHKHARTIRPQQQPHRLGVTCAFGPIFTHRDPIMHLGAPKQSKADGEAEEGIALYGNYSWMSDVD